MFRKLKEKQNERSQVRATKKLNDLEFAQFIQAACDNSLAIVKATLEQKPEYLNKTTPKGGNTALIKAAKHGSLDVVNFLIEKKAYKNICNKNGLNASDQALKYKRYGVWQALNKKKQDFLATAIDVLTIVNGFTEQFVNNHSRSHTYAYANDRNISSSHTSIASSYSDTASSYSASISSVDEILSTNHKKTNTVINKEPDFQDRLDNCGFKGELSAKCLCPISREAMNDPITISSTGITYDRDSLKSYFAANGNPQSLECPVTRKPILKKELTVATSYLVKGMIEEEVSAKEKEMKDKVAQESSKTNISIANTHANLHHRSNMARTTTTTTTTTTNQMRKK